MTKYPSIETVFVRDNTTKILNFGEIRVPEVECVKVWSISEKVDGTNIRAIVTRDGITIKGRTDAAQIPSGLEEAVLAALPAHESLINYFREYGGRVDEDDWSVTFYGEGYGAGIQKGGVYSDTKRFRVFDLILGEKTWVDDDEMRRVCQELAIPVVPFITYVSDLPVTEDDLTKLLPHSIVAIEDKGDSTVTPEGIVAKPVHVLLDKYGDRVMWKLTHREWDKIRQEAA